MGREELGSAFLAPHQARSDLENKRLFYHHLAIPCPFPAISWLHCQAEEQ